MTDQQTIPATIPRLLESALPTGCESMEPKCFHRRVFERKTLELNTKVCIYMLKTSALVFFFSLEMLRYFLFFSKNLYQFVKRK